MDVRQVMHAVAHCGYHPKIPAAAAQCPEQLLFIVIIGDHDATICQHDLRGGQIVEGEAKATYQ